MCLAVPGRILSLDGEKAQVDFKGLRREADISLMDGLKVGDYVLVHAGFAIMTVDEEEAKRSYGLLAEMMGAADGSDHREDS